MGRLSPFRAWIFITFLGVAALLTGCRDVYYDEEPVYSAHEHLTREDRAEELVYAIRQAGLAGVALVAGAEEGPVSEPFPTPPPAPDNNELVMKALSESGGTLIPFVTPELDAPDPLAVFKDMHTRGARGLALWPKLGRPARLSDARLEPLYRYLELYGVPAFVSLDTNEQLVELSTLLFDHPELKVIGASLLGHADSLATVLRFMELHGNVFVSLGFDGAPGFEKKLQGLLADEPQIQEFFTLMQDRILFAGGLTFDHRLERHGIWGMQVLKGYRAFLERSDNTMRFMDADRVWRPQHFGGLSLDSDILEKIYFHNFHRVIGKSFQERPPIDFDLLVLDAPEGWRYSPIAPTRLLPALVCSPRKLMERISTQRLRDVFAGKLTDWRDLNGEPGPIRLASLGPLMRIAAAQLDAPLVAPMTEYETVDELKAAMRADENLLGLIPTGALDGRLAVVTIDGDNPLVGNLMFCASKSSPTISAYFPNYPLLIPIEWPGDESPRRFDPYEIRTIVLGGTVHTPPGFDPEAVRTGRIVSKEGKEIEDRLAQRIKPVYSISPSVRKAEIAVFLEDGPSDVFLLRALGGRVAASASGVRTVEVTESETRPSVRTSIRGVPVTVSTSAGGLSHEGINILVLDGSAPGSDADSTTSGADVVIRDGRITALAGVGATDIPLGVFLGDEGAAGAFATLSFYGSTLSMVRVTPVETREQMVQRRYGPDSRTLVIDAWNAPDPADAPPLE